MTHYTDITWTNTCVNGYRLMMWARFFFFFLFTYNTILYLPQHIQHIPTMKADYFKAIQCDKMPTNSIIEWCLFNSGYAENVWKPKFKIHNFFLFGCFLSCFVAVRFYQLLIMMWFLFVSHITHLIVDVSLKNTESCKRNATGKQIIWTNHCFAAMLLLLIRA